MLREKLVFGKLVVLVKRLVGRDDKGEPPSVCFQVQYFFFFCLYASTIVESVKDFLVTL